MFPLRLAGPRRPQADDPSRRAIAVGHTYLVECGTFVSREAGGPVLDAGYLTLGRLKLAGKVSATGLDCLEESLKKALNQVLPSDMNDLHRKTFLFGPFRMEVDDRILLRQGQLVPLAPKEFDTLLVLVENAGRLVSKEDLIAQVWPDTFVGDGSLARNISVLRKALGDDLIQTAPKLGYRFTANITVERSNGHAVQPAETEVSAAPALPSIVAPQPPTQEAGKWRVSWRIVALLIFILVGVLLAYRQVRPAQARNQDATGPVKIAVLPFENLTGNAAEEYLCDGLTEAMISELSRLNPGKLKVIARTSAMQYKKTAKQIPQIGRELDVDYLLESSVRGSGERVRVTAQLVRASDATHVWSGEYERDLKDVLDLQERVAMAIADEVNLTVAPSVDAQATRGHAVNPEAYRYYLLGRYHWNKRTREDILQSLADYQQAVQADPQYGRAYAGMADTYISLAWWGIAAYREAYAKSQSAAQTAISLDPSLAEPYASLGIVDFMYTLDWAGAETNFRRAIALDPNYSTAHHWYAEYLAAMKRPAEALQEIKKAAELDPLSLGISQNIGFVLIQAGRYQEAIQQLEKSMEIDPNNQVTHGYLALAYEWTHQYDRALDEFRTAQRLSKQYIPYAAGVAHVLALTGRRAEALAILRKLMSYRRQDEASVSAYSFAAVYAALGKNDAAIEWLKKSIEERSCTAAEFNNDPALDVLRSDPRFAELRQRLRL